MNKSFVWGLLCLALLLVHQSYAQEPTPLTCEQKAEIILKSKNDFKNYPPGLIDKMIEYITPCAEASYGRTNPSSAYAKGLLHLQKGDYAFLFGKRRELSFLHLFRAAYHQYPPAMLDHSINLLSNGYKEKHHFAYGTIANDFEKLITLDYKPDIAHYVLGYLNLKNLVTLEDFTNTSLVTKAKTHFESSNHPMAKHWLAIMQYYGYGMPKDKAKALQMLSENNIFNSRTLKQTLQNQGSDWIPISAEERLASINNYNTHRNPITLIGSGKTNFQGHFIEYDWTAAGVKRYIPVTLSVTKRQDHGTYDDIRLELTMNGETKIHDIRLAKITSTTYESGFGFGQFIPLVLPSLQNDLQDHPDHSTLTYSIQGLNFKQATVDGKQALIVKATRYTEIEELKEKVYTPLRMVLYPETPASATASITDTSLKSAKPLALDKNFATISPNPIGNEFAITYTLDQAAEVEVAVYDFYGKQRIYMPGQKHIAKGTQTITVDSAALPSGTYVIQMTINGAPYSKTVVKL
ncbi:T9SS type A sorting domain-containing protein [Aquimarina macrocephali]|uniref:T9SS type A sorting domain-containing protein n=1 Tax=Aquimarina macrocephali TaxID=666563 RepID=UPI0004B178CC|nr:T9SS type A sorting domain-containing protein [Aquimarina macrocephali]